MKKRGAFALDPTRGPHLVEVQTSQTIFESKLVETVWGQAWMHLKSKLYISLTTENTLFCFSKSNICEVCQLFQKKWERRVYGMDWFEIDKTEKEIKFVGIFYS